MPIHELKEQISRLPEQPGVYLWMNGQRETIYVGKARSLRDRVRSYLGAYGISPRHDALLDEIRSFVGAVRTGSRPVVSGEDGLRALETATRIADLVNRGGGASGAPV